MAGPRIRTLKPEILEDEKTAPLSDTAFRLFTSLVILADDWGNVRCDVRLLEAQIWWAHTSKPNVLSALLELCRASLIEVYAVRGGTYAHLRGWEKHQRIDNAGKNRVPKPDDADATVITVDDTFVDRLAETRRESPRIAAGSGSGSGKGPGGDQDLDAAAKSPRTVKRCLPNEWKPARTPANLEAERIASERGVDIALELQKLRDWAVGGNAKKADWDSTWRNWTRNARPAHGRSQNKTPLELQLERVRMLEELERNGDET